MARASRCPRFARGNHVRRCRIGALQSDLGTARRDARSPLRGRRSIRSMWSMKSMPASIRRSRSMSTGCCLMAHRRPNHLRRRRPVGQRSRHSRLGHGLAFIVLRRKTAGDVGHLCDSRVGSSHHPFAILGDKLAHQGVNVFTGVSIGA